MKTTKVNAPIKACLCWIACFLAISGGGVDVARAQVSSERATGLAGQRERGLEMLREIKRTIDKNYFDPTYHSVDLNKHFSAAEDQIKDAVSGDQIYGIIAQSLLVFEDSHTFFIPPVWSFDVEYGWEMRMIGDECYVVAVDTGSDAAVKGVRPGDKVLAVFDIPPTRANLWQLEFLFYRLRPLRAMNVVLAPPGAKPRSMELFTATKPATWKSVVEQQARQRKSIHSYKEWGNELFFWKMGDFRLNDHGIDDMMGRVGQRNALILDLRGNPGGFERTLQRLVGYFFDHDVTLCEQRGRQGGKPIVAKTVKDKTFKGKLVVLVDSATASAGELFARVIQLEKRGIVLGDRTAGAVTEAKHFYLDYRLVPGFVTSPSITYGVSVTINDLIMRDGKSLEHTGVTPDETLLPTAVDLRAGNDPALLRAAQLLGVQIN